MFMRSGDNQSMQFFFICNGHDGPMRLTRHVSTVYKTSSSERHEGARARAMRSEWCANWGHPAWCAACGPQRRMGA